jgi:hypothetical protein
VICWLLRRSQKKFLLESLEICVVLSESPRLRGGL